MMEFQLSWIEWVGFIAALIYLYFSVNQKIWLWPMGILSSLFYMIVFFKTHLYADMILQLYYLVVSIIGWMLWRERQIEEGKEKTHIVKASSPMLLKLLLVFVLLYVFLAYLLVTVPPMLNIASSDLPYWDAFTTAASFVATWMLAKKMIDQWLVWIVVDAVAMGMYIYKELYLTSVLFFVYSAIAVWGYYAWLADLKKERISINN
ncbi:nicotinamide mononucleotide transporter [Labilibacter sediminis]|nr:nicotinamide mononucleotide transporter [Labilibacter sediminis]